MSSYPIHPDLGWYDPKVVVALYAAVVGTFSLGWNILKEIKDNTGKIKVEATINTMLVGVPGSEFIKFPALNIRITNFGKSKRYIYQPSITLQEKVMGTKNYMYYSPFEKFLGKEPKSFPYTLESGQVFEDNIRIDGIYDDLLKNLKKTKKIIISVTDSLDKRYISKPIKIKAIEKLIKTVNEIEKQKKNI